MQQIYTHLEPSIELTECVRLCLTIVLFVPDCSRQTHLFGRSENDLRRVRRGDGPYFMPCGRLSWGRRVLVELQHVQWRHGSVQRFLYQPRIGFAPLVCAQIANGLWNRVVSSWEPGGQTGGSVCVPCHPCRCVHTTVHSTNYEELTE